MYQPNPPSIDTSLSFILLDRTKTTVIDRTNGLDATGFFILRTPKPARHITSPDTLVFDDDCLCSPSYHRHRFAKFTSILHLTNSNTAALYIWLLHALSPSNHCPSNRLPVYRRATLPANNHVRCCTPNRSINQPTALPGSSDLSDIPTAFLPPPCLVCHLRS